MISPSTITPPLLMILLGITTLAFFNALLLSLNSFPYIEIINLTGGKHSHDLFYQNTLLKFYPDLSGLTNN